MTDYYMRADGTAANKGAATGPGTSQSACMNIAVHNGETFSAGDVIYLCADGGDYTTELLPPSSGSAGNPITYQNEAGDTPIIDGTGDPTSLAWTDGMFNIQGKSYIMVIGIKSQDSAYSAFVATASSDNIIFDNCFGFRCGSSGFFLYNSTNITVTNCEVDDCCIGPSSQEAISFANVQGIECTYNEVHDITPTGNGGEGIDVKEGSTNATVLFNHVYNLIKPGIYSDAWDGAQDNIEIGYNHVHDIAGENPGISISCELSGTNDNNRVHHNLVYNIGGAGIIIGSWPGGQTSVMDVIEIDNNTIYNVGTGYGIPWRFASGIYHENHEATNVKIRNNIIKDAVYAQIMMEADASATIDTNLIEAYQGETQEQKGSNVIEADPLFVDAAAGNFQLQAGSPAIDTGLDLGYISDHKGTSIPQGSAPDIGAYEFEQESPSPVVILGATSTPQSSLSENTEIDEFWESYFRDIERAQGA